MALVIRHCDGETIYTSEAHTLAKAVEEAVAVGANLIGANLTGANLTGAYLAGAYLDKANLTGANLTGADLTGANLSWADLTDADLTGARIGDYILSHLVARMPRTIDRYEFIGFATDRGLLIRAGCRTLTPAGFRAHVAAKYPGTPKAEETLAILDYIESRAVKLCAPVEPAKAEAR